MRGKYPPENIYVFRRKNGLVYKIWVRVGAIDIYSIYRKPFIWRSEISTFKMTQRMVEWNRTVLRFLVRVAHNMAMALHHIQKQPNNNQNRVQVRATYFPCRIVCAVHMTLYVPKIIKYFPCIQVQSPPNFSFLSFNVGSTRESLCTGRGLLFRSPGSKGRHFLVTPVFLRRLVFGTQGARRKPFYPSNI